MLNRVRLSSRLNILSGRHCVPLPFLLKTRQLHEPLLSRLFCLRQCSFLYRFRRPILLKSTRRLEYRRIQFPLYQGNLQERLFEFHNLLYSMPFSSKYSFYSIFKRHASVVTAYSYHNKASLTALFSIYLIIS